MVEVEHLERSYGSVRALHDVNLTVHRGEIFGLLGPNGAGKTTLMECIQGLRHRTGGSVRVLGLDPEADGARLRARIGSQLQDSALPKNLRVKEAIDLFAGLASRPVDACGLLQRWGLGPIRQRRFGALSGGERQRLFLALALITQPEVVFLDELTTGLDPHARRLAWQLIEGVRARGSTVVLVTHYPEEAQRLCDRLAIVQRGRVAALGTPNQILEQAGSQVVVRFTCDRGLGKSSLGSLPGVQSVEQRNGGVRVTGGGACGQHVASALLQRGIEPPDLTIERGDLEDAYLDIVERETPA